MSATIVVGLQWGDEGKGKVIDYFSKNAALVARFNGGENAGHTVIYKDKVLKLHHIPSGVFHGKPVILGCGMVINPVSLINEIESLKELDIPLNILISSRAHVVLPHHIMIDNKEGKKLGTTGKGIGPAYAGKMMRTGIRMCDIVSPSCENKIKEAIDEEKELLVSLNLINEQNFEKFKEEVIKTYIKAGEVLKKYVFDTESYVREALKNKSEVLLEGAQGVMLDIDAGTYPFVTSSNTTAHAAFSGSGANPFDIKNIVGVSKAYTTRVGIGPFPTEIFGSDGDIIRNIGNEYGATTGRPRRVGYLDLVALKYAIDSSSVKEIFLTKVDVLSSIKTIKVAIDYTLDGEIIKTYPAEIDVLNKIKVIYKELPSLEELSKSEWSNLKALKGKTKEVLPENIKSYIAFIEEYTDIPVKYLSYGPGGDETLEL